MSSSALPPYVPVSLVSERLIEILVDLAPAEPLLLFVEVVATDGPVNHRRRNALLALTDAAGFPSSRVAFLSAYADRNAAAFKMISVTEREHDRIRTVAGLLHQGCRPLRILSVLARRPDSSSRSR